MKLLQNLFINNERWASRALAEDAEYFERHVCSQAPPFYWLGCSDSRVPCNQVVGLDPGEMFVHRNVANLIAHKDLNSLAALQYAINLGVEHLLIVGHYGCVGVRSAMHPERLPEPIGAWLEPLRLLYDRNRTQLEAIADDQARWDMLCELNVREQVRVACELPIVHEAWRSGRPLAVHGWIYNMRDGRLRDLNVTVSPALKNTPGGAGQSETATA